MPWQAEFADAFRGQRVLVSGSTGFIGRALCKALLALGADVHGLARRGDRNIAAVRPWSVDLRDAARVDEVCNEIRPQYVFHLAAQVTARQELDLIRPMLEHNLLGTVNLLLAAMPHGCRRFVFVGTAEEPDGELRRASPSSPYTAAKTAAALYARMFNRVYNWPIVSVRPFLTYGPGQETTKLIPYTILKLLERESPRLTSANRLCDFVHVEDVVRGMLHAAQQAGVEGQTLDLGSGQVVSIRAAVELVANLIGVPGLLRFAAAPERVAEPALIADVESSRRMLGWEPRWTLKTGLAQTIRWYAEQMKVNQKEAA